MSEATEATEVAEATEAKPAREKQNGITRPAEGTTTGRVWSTADALSGELGRPVLMAELREALADVNRATVSTQYAKWCKFHGVTKEARQSVRASEKAEKEAAEAAAAAAESAEAEE